MTRTPRDRFGRGAAGWTCRLAGAAVALVGSGCNVGSLKVEPLRTFDAPFTTDDDLELARTYAPFLAHAIHESRGRQDLPTRVDFDGNLRGADDWENLPYYTLPPTVYYAVVETRTHFFLAYHLFHPRDWALLDLGLHMTHENDGENLQVVVEKSSGRVVLLLAQAHYRGRAFARLESGRTSARIESGRASARTDSWGASALGSGFSSGSETIRGPLVLVDDAGRPDPEGKHVVVFVECCGHGILGMPDATGDVDLAADGSVRFAERGLVFRPAAPGEPVAEPDLDTIFGATSARGDASSKRGAPAPVVAYALESTTRKLWPGLRDGTLVGEGGLFDGCLPLSTPEVSVGVPRYYEADRFSGPFGPDRGISPFAVDFRFGAGEVGALFFDPARRYAQCLRVPQPWSLEYVDYPFRNSR